MSRNAVLSGIGTALRRLGLAGVIASSLSLPAIWLALEARGAEKQAGLLAQAAADRAQAGLRDLFARFERATAGLRAQEVQGDTTSLTGRLLRAEPLVAPAVGLLVVNARGAQIASTLPGNAAPGAPTWLPRALAALRSRDVAVLGTGTFEARSWLLVRRIEDAQGGTAALVASVLPDEAIRALTAPTGDAAGVVDAVLHDADGHELLRGKPRPSIPAEAPTLVRLYRALLPEGWLVPKHTSATATVGNLSWTGAITPGVALGLGADDIDRRGRGVVAFAGGLTGLALLVGLASGAGRRGGGVQAADWRAAAETARREAEGLRRELDDVANERDRVLAAIGHDVRTPMNSILGICALLMDGDLGDAQRKWLQRIRASCEASLAMFNGILEIAMARVDGAEIHREAVDVARLVEEVGEVLRPQAHDKGLDLRVAVEGGVSGVWNTDPTRLRQVLFNLAGNAIKYTGHGSVEIGAMTRDGQDGRAMLRLRVSDTGPGVTDDEKGVIFEQFRRGRDEVAHGQVGLGLGLALCREIASLLGGDLSVESTPPAGSVFTFEVPIERTQNQETPGTPLAGRTALVVGLSEGMRRRVASHLEGVGFDVETTGDGFVTLGLAERTSHRHGALDFMILDAALVGLPADVLLARLRANAWFEPTRVALVTNGGFAGAAGGQADAAVPHPVEAGDLDRVVAELFGAAPPPRAMASRAPETPGARVLVVEDNRVYQALLLDVLGRAGFSALGASSGEEAVQAAERGGFDAVLMDVQMPGIDGAEATRVIRANGQQRRIPIIGLTAHSGATMRERCLDAGMNLVLHKPVNLSRLPLQLREAIAAAHPAGEDGAGARSGGGDVPPDIADEYLEVLVAEVGVERARAHVTELLADMVDQSSVLSRLQSKEDWQALADLAHRIAGAVGIVGAVSLADQLLVLEDAARLKEKTRVVAALRDVQATWQRTRTSLPDRFEFFAGKWRDTGVGKAA